MRLLLALILLIGLSAQAQITISNATMSGVTSGSALLATANNFTASNTFSSGMMIWGDANKTNGVLISPSGEVLSNAVGSVTIAGGNVTATGTIFGTATNASRILASRITIGLTNPCNLVIAGDSLSNSGDLYSWWDVLTNNFPNYLSLGGIITNHASSGWKLSDLTNDYASAVYPYRPAGGTNAVLIVWIGANGLSTDFGGMPGWGSAWSNYVTTAKNDGFRVMAFTVLANGNQLNETWEKNRVRANNLIRHFSGPSTKLDWLVDVDRMFSDPFDTTYFLADSIHPNYTGSTNIAFAVNEAFSRPGSSAYAGDSYIVQFGTNWYFRSPSDGVALATIAADGSVTATSFSGAGTGLTGTAASLSVGGTAASAAQTLGGAVSYSVADTSAHYSPWSGAIQTATIGNVNEPIVRPGAASFYIVSLAASQDASFGDGTNMVYTLVTNGVATSIALTTTSAYRYAVNTSFSVGPLTNGSSVGIKYQSNCSTNNTSRLYWSFIVQ